MLERRLLYRDLLKLMLPLAIQNLMVTMISATDALVLARLDQYSVAAVSLAAEINFVMNLFLGAVIGGISILVSQYYGKGDRQTVGNLLGMGLRYHFLISLIFFAAAQFAPGILMRIYTDDEKLIQIGVQYLKIASWSYLLSAISQCYMCILKISGGASLSAIIAAVAACVDVIVDILLVYGLQLGAVGTAWSTVAVCLMEWISVIIFSFGTDRIRPNWKNLAYFSKELRMDFYKLSLPVLAGGLIWGIGFSLSAAIMGHLNADASSAYAIAALVRSLFACLIQGLGSGVAILVGKELGRGDLTSAKQCGIRLAKISIWCGAFSAILFYLLSPFVFRIFVLNEVTREYLHQMAPICAVYLAAQAVSVTVICGIFPAGGDTIFDVKITAVTMWLIALPAGYLCAFVFHLPVTAVYLALCLDELTKVLFVYPRFQKYHWLKNMTRDKNHGGM